MYCDPSRVPALLKYQKGRGTRARDIYDPCNVSFVALLLFLFGVFGGMCGENSCNVSPLLFMVLWVLISATLWRRAVLMLWHAFLFLGLRFFPPFSLYLVVSAAFSCKTIT
jgi:hypothetical protein